MIADESNKPPPRKDRLIDGLKEVYNSFASSTSAHGFHWTISSASIYRKIGWTILVIFFCIFAVYTSYKMGEEYIFGSGYTTDIDIVQQSVYAQGVVMPDFIICDPNPWDLEKAKNVGVSIDMVSYLSYFIYPDYNPDLSPETLQKDLELEYRKEVSRFGSFENLLGNVTRSCEEFVKWCRIGLGKNMKEECCSRILDTGRYVMEGKCFSSRDKLHYKPKYSDKILGISLGLLLGEDISDKLNPAIAPFWSMATRGAAIGLMDKRDDIPSVAARDLTLLLPDTIARIAISKEVKDTSRMSESFMHRMDCIPVDQEDRMLDEQTVLNDYPGLKHYSVEGCEGYYIQKQLFKLYNCTVLYFPEIPGAQVCGPMQTAELLKIASDANFDYESYNITTASENVCPETCRKTRYSSKISSIKMTESIHEVMRGYTGLKSGDFEAVMVSMYYQGFDYREITFVGKGMKEWLAAVGGNLGLYIGASVFTILEFFILIEEAILGMISRMFKGNERS